MGAAASVIQWKQKEIMTVDQPGPGWRKVKTFSRAIFKKFEWETLKVFCQKYEIAQRDLVRVFQQYLASDEAYIREFRVRALDARNKFGKYSKLFQEISDIFIPAMYLRKFTGLVDIDSGQEISFSRFIIHSYIFGCQQFPDLIYDFFAVLRQKLDIQLSVVISPFSVAKIVDILTEEFDNVGTLKVLKDGLKRLEQGPDVRLFAIIHMGVKYPLLFYAVERFRKLYKRFVFGDKFWAGRKFIKLRHIDMSNYLDEDLDICFTNLEIATRRTALSIIADSLMMVNTEKNWFPNEVFRLTPTLLVEAQVTQLKRLLGYKAARAVLLDSGISLDFTASFLQSHIVHATVASPPSKNIPVSPWNDSDMEMSPNAFSDHYDSMPSSPQQQPQSQLSPSHARNSIDFPLIGYDVEVEEDDEEEQSSEDGRQPQKINHQSSDHYLRTRLRPSHSIVNTEATAATSEQHLTNAEQDQVEQQPNGEDNGVERDGVLVIHDNQFDKDFRYDVHTGRSRWHQVFVNPYGQVVREVCF